MSQWTKRKKKEKSFIHQFPLNSFKILSDLFFTSTLTIQCNDTLHLDLNVLVVWYMNSSFYPGTGYQTALGPSVTQCHSTVQTTLNLGLKKNKVLQLFLTCHTLGKYCFKKCCGVIFPDFLWAAIEPSKNNFQLSFQSFDLTLEGRAL